MTIHVPWWILTADSCAISPMAFSFYLLDYVTLGRISKCGDRGKKIEIKIEPQPKLCKISVEDMLIRLEVNFSPKHKLICNYFRSNGFYIFYSCKQPGMQSFCSISLTFPVIFFPFSFSFFFLLISENCSVADVIQLIKSKKASGLKVHLLTGKSSI